MKQHRPGLAFFVVLTPLGLLTAFGSWPFQETVRDDGRKILSEQGDMERLASSMLVPIPGPDVPYRLRRQQGHNGYFGQVGQDGLVDRMLRRMEGGFFVECGALDGEKNSNTLFFELNRNWTGLLIEASPKMFPLMLAKHRRAHLLNGCLSAHPYASVEKFKMSRNSGFSGLADVAVTSASHRRRQHKRYRTVEVQCIPLGPVLSVLGVSTVHFFSLDVEGAEVEMLRAMPWAQVDIWVMLVETIHAQGGRGLGAIVGIMESKGYSLVARTKFDGVFARKDKIEDGTLLVEEDVQESGGRKRRRHS